MLNALVNRPNKILEKQKLYQTSPIPLYLRGPRSRVYFGMYMMGWTTGLIGAVAGMYSLVKGRPAA